MPSSLSRRRFLGTAAGSAAATIVPRHVLGGQGHVAPSDKLTFGYVGCGTQGLTEMIRMLRLPEVQIVAVCDPNEESTDYVEWSKDSVRREIAEGLGKPGWREGTRGVPGGRAVGREVTELFYADQRATGGFRGVAAYADFREMLDKEDLDAVKVMTPDHLHATVALAAMRRGRSVLMHKPLANRLLEARLVVEAAGKPGIATHFLPASAGDSLRLVRGWIDKGAIGTLREIHNWSNRPVWPQYPEIPADTPPVPKGLDWDLWLGPSMPRAYHPHYTHAVFRGWYEFGGGAVADMGHYSLWPVFQQFDLDAPVSVETTPSHVCTLADGVAVGIRNDWSFPAACTIRFRFAAKGSRPALDLFWYDGGIRPPAPAELDEDGRELAAEGMMFVGDRGKILAGFRCDDPMIVPYRKAREFRSANGPTVPPPAADGERPAWLDAFRGGPPTYGSFRLAGPISDAFNLAAISLRLGGQRLLWDAAAAKITNRPEANALLGREYRKGWELAAPEDARDPGPVGGTIEVRDAEARLNTNTSPGGRRPTEGASAPPTVIGPGTLVRGDLESDGPVYVHGTLDGDCRTSAHCFVHEGARVLGNITASALVVAGEVEAGMLTADKVEVRASAKVVATIRARVIAIQDGAFFQGQFEKVEGPGPSRGDDRGGR